MTICCIMCGTVHEVEVTPEQLKAWQGGELIQNAMPNLRPNERELLMTQICGKCFDELFPAED